MERRLRSPVRLTAGLLLAGSALLAPALLAPALLAPAGLAPAGLAAAAGASDGSELTVPLPAGESLPPGTYQVVIRGDGKQITATVVVPAAPGGPAASAGSQPATPSQPARPSAGGASEPAAPGGARSPAGTGGQPWLIRLLVLALVAVAGFLAYSRVLVPLRHVRSYRRALGLLGADQHDEALPELTRLDGVLPPRQRAAARFFIAFALYRLDRLDEAEHRLAALNRENPHDVEVAYLLAYVRVGRRDFDGAEPVLAALESTGRLGAANARRLYGVVQFQRAMEAFRDGRIDAAAELFEKAEQLGDFRDQIPVDLRNRHVVLGAQALFDKDVRAARTQFEHLEQAAGRLPAGERDRTLASAKLGLALAAWIENAPGSPAAMEALLTDAAALLDPAGSLTLDWPAEATGSGLAERLAALADGGGQPAEQVELDRMLRDIHLLRGAGVLRTWADADRAEAAERADSYRADALARFACARDRDPDFSDVYLVVGLLQYYLASTGPDRASAVALLREAQKLGTRDPEVLQAINQHDRVRPENRDAVDAYLQVLDRYLQDGTVRAQVRAALVQRLAQYGKLRDWDSRQELLQVRTVAPTVAEMNDRSELLRERVRQLLAMQPGAADLAAAGDLARSLERSSQVLAEQARSVEEMEAELLGLVGDRLLANPVR